MVLDMKIIKQELEFEECLKQRLEFICEFSKVTHTFINSGIRKIDEEYRTTLINFGQSKYFIINFTMAKLMEMEQTDRNKIALYLFNSIEE